MNTLKLNLLLAFFIVLYSCGEDCKFNSITTGELPVGIVGQTYNEQITYDITCSYSMKKFELISGSLPKGIDLSPSGVFSGIPSDTGTFSFRIKGRMCFSSNGFEYTDCHDLEKALSIMIVSQ